MMGNERGTVFIPVRLLISITMIAAISSIAFIAYENAMRIADEKNVENMCNKILSKLQEMKEKGKVRDIDNPNGLTGDRREFYLNLPNSLEYLSFGCAPDDNHTIINDGHCIIYKIKGGSKHIIWVNEFGFRKGVIENDTVKITRSGYICNGGRIKLLMELIFYDGRYYALIMESGQEG